MRKRIVSLAVAVGLAAVVQIAAAVPSIPPQRPAEKPNIVFFLVDDMGWQDTSLPFWNQTTPLNQRYHTPNMERLASQGMKFTQAYVCAVCSPTRISFMTGYNATRHRVTNWTLFQNRVNDGKHARVVPPQWNSNGLQPKPGIPRTVAAKCLPEYLREAGYHTIHVGKAHLGAIGTPGAEPKNLGFDVNIAGHAAGGPGSFLGTQNYSAEFRQGGAHWNVPHLEEYHGTDTFLTEALTIEALKTLDDARYGGKPFFLHMSHYAVHVPFAPDDRFFQKYLDAGLDRTEAMYAAMVEGMDKSLGDIMEYLEKHDLVDNTVVFFLSDNGGLSNHGRGGKPETHNLPLACGKGSPREGGVRVPMIARWPGVTRPGSVCEDYLIIEDCFTTILEIAGARPDVAVDGVSFVPLLKGETGLNRGRPLVWHFPNIWGQQRQGYGPYSSLRLDDWKYIFYHNPAQSVREELFHIPSDIGETKNLAATAPEKLQEMRQTLREYLKQVDAPMPTDAQTGDRIQIP
jgi:arylsulfatase A-like enzyme